MGDPRCVLSKWVVRCRRTLTHVIVIWCKLESVCKNPLSGVNERRLVSFLYVFFFGGGGALLSRWIPKVSRLAFCFDAGEGLASFCAVGLLVSQHLWGGLTEFQPDRLSASSWRRSSSGRPSDATGRHGTGHLVGSMVGRKHIWLGVKIGTLNGALENGTKD